MKLKEWNEACKYANDTCIELNKSGYKIKYEMYKMSDGSKGIKFLSYDVCDWLFAEYSTGIHENLPSIKKAIDETRERIAKS